MSFQYTVSFLESPKLGLSYEYSEMSQAFINTRYFTRIFVHNFLLLFSRLFRESACFAIFLSTTSLIHFFCPRL